MPAPELASLLLFAVKLPFLYLLCGGTVLSGDQFAMLCLCSLEKTCGSGASESIYALGQALMTDFDGITGCNVKAARLHSERHGDEKIIKIMQNSHSSFKTFL